MSKKLFAIFGDPVSHSRSPLMHNSVFKKLNYKACYTRVRLEDGTKLRETFFDLKLYGANITVPHKEAAFKACDEIRGFAKEVGVVNTIVREGEKLIGYNTDADGFMFAIKDFKNIRSVLVLGAGGTAKALSKKFQLEGMDVTLLNRSESRLVSYREDGFKTFTFEDFKPIAYDLVVNTTSAGLQDEAYPAPLKLLTKTLKECNYAADAIYGKVTPFLKLCSELKIESIDGAKMLLGQGVLASHYFSNKELELSDIEREMKHSFSI